MRIISKFHSDCPSWCLQCVERGKRLCLGVLPFLLEEGDTALEWALHPGVQIWNDFVTWVILSLLGHRWDHCLTKVRFHRGKSAVLLLVGTESSIEMWFLFLLCFLPQASSAVVSGSSAGGKFYPVLLCVTLKEHIVHSVQKSARVCHKEMVHTPSWLFVCPQSYYII